MRQDSDGVTTNLRIEDLKKWRDRIFEAIDTGYIIRVNTFLMHAYFPWYATMR